MTNYGSGYVLAALARRVNARQVRLLVAIETFRADPDGWRQVSQAKLAEFANLDLSTLRRARDELIEAKLIEYQPSHVKGVFSRYRITIPPLDRGSPADPPTRKSIGGQRPANRGSARPPKGVTRKPDIPSVPAGQTPDFDFFARPAALSAEAEALLKLSASAPGSTAAAPDGAAALPADPRDGIPFYSLSNLCREEQHDTCGWQPCACRCHRGEQERERIRVRAEAIAEAKADLARIRQESRR